MQQTPDMIDVVVDAKTTLHELGHARTSPQVSVETSGLRTFEQQRLESTFVLSRQFRWPSWRRLGSYSSFAASSRCRLPTSNAAAIHANAPRYFRWQQSFLKQRQRTQASALQLLWASGWSHRAPPTGMIGH
ncbi:MAG TPA: hypothetical protein VGK37_17270 [Casimicrobiaceae bacterium]|jgi:hypothetical protein